MRLAFVAFGVLVLSALPDAALAHAILLRVDPPTGRTLPGAPPTVRLLFSEPIDPEFSRVQVLDETGKQVDQGDSRVDDTQLTVSLQTGLGNGVYIVNWRSLSTIDVHPETGQYALFVGVPPTATGTLTQRNESTPGTIVARWWLYVAASVFAGSLAAWKLVFGPVLGTDSSARSVALARVHRVALVAGVLLLVGTLFAAVAQAAAAAGVPMTSAFGNPLRDLLTRGRFAGIWWPRLGISVVAFAIVAWRGLDDAWSESAAAMVPAILLTNSLTSHGATLPLAVVGVVLDWVHVLAAAIWVGGLANLAIVAPVLRRADSSVLPGVVRRFTRLAIVSVLAILVSGAVQAALEIGSWEGLVGTSYGQGVLVKVALLAGMIGLAALHQRRGGRLPFERGVRLELALGLVVLAVAAVVAGTTPARQTSAPGTATAAQVNSP
ncbi:MAG TPA: copper resistance protein CopC [Chloroflexota bacterium]